MRFLFAFIAALAVAPAASGVTVTPAPVRISFGDPVVVSATASGDRSLELDLGSWTALGEPETRRRNGSTTVEQKVVCLAEACVPAGPVGSVALPAAIAGETRTVGRIVVATRVPLKAVGAPKAPYRRNTTLVEPREHGGALLVLAGAAAALVAAAVLLLRAGRRGDTLPVRSPQDSLARALRLLRESAGRPAPDRRRAADLVGRLVPAVTEPALRAAWSQRDPSPDEVEALAGSVEAAR